MLEEKLNPLLAQLRIEQREEKANFEIVRNWFLECEENLAESIEDMAFICKLPDKERHLLTYPIMGNWYLDKMARFEPKTDHQREIYSLLRELVKETRFCIGHHRKFYDKVEEYNKKDDDLNSKMLARPHESMVLDKLITKISDEIYEAVKAIYRRGEFVGKDCTIDLGHGLSEPSDAFRSLTTYLACSVEYHQAKPLDLTVMVVDDQRPEEWYQRMISVGFKHQEGQKGYFFDCESALEALSSGHYDVVLADLELGEKKMGGIEFVERAYEIQKRKGIKPRISVFSYNDKKLEEAQDRWYDFFSEEPKVFHQVIFNNKARFTAIGFRSDVELTL